MSLANRFRCLLSVIGIFLPFYLAQAQDPYFKHFRVEDGLPSNEVYGMVFDDRNVLWATTDRGVWRYDGYQSKHFTVSQGLFENTNFRIFKDAQNRIWLSSINNNVCQIVGDSVIRHPISSEVKRIGESRKYLQQLMEDKDSSVLICYNRPGLFRFKPGQETKKITSHWTGQPPGTLCIFLEPDGYYWDMNGSPDTTQSLPNTVSREGNRIYLHTGYLNNQNHFRKNLNRIGPNEFLFSYNNKAFHFRNDSILSSVSFKTDINTVYCDYSGDFWIGLLGEGAFRFPGGSFDSKPVRYLPNEQITMITQDLEGSYWIATALNGIYQANSMQSIYRPYSSDNEGNIITAMTSNGPTLYIGTQTGELFKALPASNDFYTLARINGVKNSESIRKLYVNENGNLLIFKMEILEMGQNQRVALATNVPGYAYDYAPLSKNEWIASYDAVLKVFKNKKIQRTWDKDNVPDLLNDPQMAVAAINRIRCLYFDKSRRLWLGSQGAGLISSQNRKISFWSEKDSLLGRRIHDIIEAGPNIWASVADYGIAVVRTDSTIAWINQKMGLSSDIVDVLFAENDSVVWAGTNLGVNKITVRPDDLAHPKIEYFTMREGLPSNRVFQILRHQGKIWIATTQGAVCLDPEFIKPKLKGPPLTFDTVQVNGVNRRFRDDMIFRADQNNLFFKFRAVSFYTPNTIQYRYLLDGIDTAAIVTPNPEARYSGLRHGRYFLRVKASYTNDFKTVEERTFSFVIRKHWYDTQLFYILLVLTLAGAVYLLFLTVLRDLKNREKQKQRLLEAEKRSLLSQMNPHFIFNSLNSIQHFIIQNDDLQANNYLTNFSALIRKILENSKKNLITLSEEIATLTLYLEMEKLRFEDGFEYKINRDLNIDYNEVMIPPMILQPFVENAIWHGIMPLRTKGLLTITFSRIDGYFHCLIRDNGIGRENAGRLKGKKEPHNSTGMTNISERISLMNRINKKKIKLNVTDLKNEDGTAAGTLIEIIIPLYWE